MQQLYNKFLYLKRTEPYLLTMFGMLFRKQNLILSPKYKNLKKLENIHYGKRLFIVCTGPSLTIDDLEKLKGEICFSMNSIVQIFNQTNWRPLYYMLNNSKDIIEHVEIALSNSDLKNIFCMKYVQKRLSVQQNATFFNYPIINKAKEFKDSEHINPRNYRFSGDLYKGISGGATTANAIFQIAVYMGFKKIYLLGCDLYAGHQLHFGPNIYSEKFPQETIDKVKRKILFGSQAAKEYTDAHGIKIYNATRGGDLEVFERVDLDEVLAKKETSI